MNFKKVDAADIVFFQQAIGVEYVYTDEASIKKYSVDETVDASFAPEVVLKPVSAEEISKILSYCNQQKIPVSPRAAGTGLSANSLPVEGGITLSIERMNHILEIDERSLQVTTEPGVVTEFLQNTLKEKGLFYPPDPSSRGSCFIGGNVACNSGGPRAVKYGVVKDYVLNLEVVLPSGKIMWTGANVLKNSTGYNFTQLFVGSEGTLGIITKIVLKLIPHPTTNVVMLVPFNSMEKASEAVSAVFRAGIVPSCLEFMERDAIEWVCKFLGDVTIAIDDETQAHLLIEMDGNDMAQIQKECEKLYEVISEFGCGEILFADSEAQKNDLWRMRRNAAYAIKKTAVTIEEDTVVPRADLPILLKSIKRIGAKYGFKSVCYGHAGDGNVHVRIVKGELSDEAWKNIIQKKAVREIFEEVHQLKGTISGEHGIGWIQRQYMDIKFDEEQLNLMRGVKAVFDPNGILNPSKIF
ncbi:MAG: FAD-binding protein [Chitinophagales bacterium]|nr:FAD-binding protein [Chitinophagales bacterium]MCO5279865.1 FAD-binding protein [Chitinophagales bacterium]OJV30552.1 MAG: FAD-binding oxidoreductase [Bacteroidetes bacterium 37-13]HRN94697.1 FAD-linked oxidase C-terminal domain-containing protein [Chitinophagales bacterium]HRP38863.1 FAD-linked oxidase C-terminal domain-containing protein [Chitinophagales bacterium]